MMENFFNSFVHKFAKQSSSEKKWKSVKTYGHDFVISFLAHTL